MAYATRQPPTHLCSCSVLLTMYNVLYIYMFVYVCINLQYYLHAVKRGRFLLLTTPQCIVSRCVAVFVVTLYIFGNACIQHTRGERKLDIRRNTPTVVTLKIYLSPMLGIFLRKLYVIIERSLPELVAENVHSTNYVRSHYAYHH